MPGLLSFPSFHPATNGSDSAATTKSTTSFLSPITALVRRPAAKALDGQDGEGTTTKPEAPLHDETDLKAQKAVLYMKLHEAITLEDWRGAAAKLDELEGNDAWKEERETRDYDVGLVESRLRQFDQARAAGDAKQILYLLRTSLTRHLGRMGNVELYQKSHIGTKRVIENYITSALSTLDKMLELSAVPEQGGLDTRYVLDQLLQARQAFGRSALLLSGGATFGLNHLGVVRTLHNKRLLPRIISGSSAGSIVAGGICTRTDDEIPGFIEAMATGEHHFFTKEGEQPTLLQQVARFLKYGNLYDVTTLQVCMRAWMGDLTFQEAYNRTRFVLNICVSSESLFELPRLLNYITAPNVVIWSAIAASCSVPVVFSPGILLAKDPKTGEFVNWNPSPSRWVDGSIDGDLPMTRLSEMFNVNHFIVSQVNPHVIPFLPKGEDTYAGRSAPSRLIETMSSLARDEAMHRMQILSEMGIGSTLFTKLRQVLSQRYSGDITILPDIPYSHFPLVLENPTEEFVRECTLCGERATWPKMSRIENHCRIELALDDAVQQLRARVAFSPDEVNLRLQKISSIRSDGGDRSRQGRGQRTRRKTAERINVTNALRPKLPASRSTTMAPRTRARTSVFQLKPAIKVTAGTPQSVSPNPGSPQRAASPTAEEEYETENDDDEESGSQDDSYEDEEEITEEDDDEENSIIDSDEEEEELEVEEDEEYFPYAATATTTPTWKSSRPPIWPTGSQLFPHASVPTTPAGASPRNRRTSYFNGASPMRISPTPSPKTAGPPHVGKLASISEVNPRPRKANNAPNRSPNGSYDHGGTRGMVIRKRSSAQGWR